eukprot:6173320-Pleurochrysis_carterae.AAC.1
MRTPDFAGADYVCPNKASSVEIACFTRAMQLFSARCGIARKPFSQGEIHPAAKFTTEIVRLGRQITTTIVTLRLLGWMSTANKACSESRAEFGSWQYTTS